jgi:putative two-component system response regulator
MKNHTRLGYEALSDCLKQYPKADYLSMAAEIALSHHEKFDGTGYPQGLKGRNIPLSARIVALSDVYDALVSRRVYKNAYSHDMACSIIQEEKCSHFDPIVADAFFSCHESFMGIYNQSRAAVRACAVEDRHPVELRAN